MLNIGDVTPRGQYNAIDIYKQLLAFEYWKSKRALVITHIKFNEALKQNFKLIQQVPVYLLNNLNIQIMDVV